MKRILIAAIAVIALCASAAAQPGVIEVNGVATVNIVPDRISVEIGLQEYYRHNAGGDSTLVRLADIDKNVRKILQAEGVADSAITLGDVGNSLDPARSRSLLMAKRINVVLDSFDRLEAIASEISVPGVSSFSLSRIDNTAMADYNRMGLKAALEAARTKAELIAAEQGLRLMHPVEIVENGPAYYETPSMSNVQLQYDGAMESMRRIVRRYSVKVKYFFMPEGESM